MTAYLLTYSGRKKEFGPKEMEALVKRFKNDPDMEDGWSFQSYKKAKVGEQVFLFKQGDDPRGIFGMGQIAKIYPPIAKNGHGKVDVTFDQLADPHKEPLLNLETCQLVLRPFMINAPAAGIPLNEEETAELNSRLRVKVNGGSKRPYVQRDNDARDDLGTDHSNQTISVVSRYDRDQDVRNAVLKRSKGKCELCGEEGFKCMSGNLYVETHHIIWLAKDGPDRR